MHAFPGWVQTDIFARLTPPESSEILWRITLAAVRGVVAVVMRFFGISTEESGERHAYYLKSESSFGRVRGGLIIRARWLLRLVCWGDIGRVDGRGRFGSILGMET